MKVVTLKLSQLLNLDAELSGVVNQSTNEELVQGILSLELDFILKYHLEKIQSQVTEEKKIIEKFRGDLIKKYGEEDDKGNHSVPYLINIKTDSKGNTISGDPNPNLEEFSKELEKFLEETVEIRVKELTIEDFAGIKLKSRPVVFFSLLEEVEQQKPTEQK